MARRGNQRGGRQTMGEQFEREEETRNLQQMEERLAQMLNGRMDALTELITQQLGGQREGNRRHGHREYRAPNPQQEEEEEDGQQFDNPFAEGDSRRSPYAPPNVNQPQKWDSNAGKELMEFTGTLGPDELIDWLGITEDVLELKRIPDEMRVPLVATKFRGRAAAWWQQLKNSRVRQGKAKIDSWEKLKKHMRSAFLPYNYVRTLFQRIQNLRQGSRSVDDYTTEFHQLVSRNDLGDSEEQLVSRYIGGMTLQFQDTLNLFDPVSVSEAHQRALNLEKQIGRKSSGAWNRGSASSTTLSRPPQPETTMGPPPRQYGTAAAPVGTGSGPVTRSHTVGVTPRCFSCGEPGHRMAECPSKRANKSLFVETETGEGTNYEEQDPLFDEEGCPEELVEGDKGPLLVVRRSCFTPRATEGDDWLRHHIFKSTCTIGGKVCSIIIDPGSCENVVSQEAVTKLQLPTEQHPKPYRLAWLKKGNLVSVSKRCLVNFSIGSTYRDKVWCDVVEMDACHLLLGRPWEFDVSASHDGRKNTYAFMFENRKIVLLPTKDVTPKESPGSSSLLILRQPVEKGVPSVTSVRNYRTGGSDGRSGHSLARVEDVPGNFVSFVFRFDLSSFSILCPLEPGRYDRYESQSSIIILSGVEESSDGGVLGKMTDSGGLKGMNHGVVIVCGYVDKLGPLGCGLAAGREARILNMVDVSYGGGVLGNVAVVRSGLVNNVGAVDGVGLYCSTVHGVWYVANSRSNSSQPGENDAGLAQVNDAHKSHMTDADKDSRNDADKDQNEELQSRESTGTWDSRLKWTPQLRESTDNDHQSTD